MKVAIYFRYSSDKAAQVENSEARQLSELQAVCLKNRWTVVWTGGDKETSGDAAKPQLMELRRQIEAKELLIDVVLVSSWDRLTRKDSMEFAEDVGWIRRAGATVAIAKDGLRILDLNDNASLLMLQMEVFQANQYLKNLSQNVRSGLTSKFKAGTLGYARSPFGFDKDGKNLTPNDDLKLVPLIFDQALKGGVASAVPTMRFGHKYQESGKAPTTSAVKAVLRNSIYIGQRTFGVAGVGKHGTIKGRKTTGTRNVNHLADAAYMYDVSGQIAPVIATETFQAVQTMLDENRVKRPRKQSSHKYSGLFRCECGAKLIGEKKVKHTNYVCPKSKNLKFGCDRQRIVGRKTLRDHEIVPILRELNSLILLEDKLHIDNFDRMVAFLKRKSLGQSNEQLIKLEKLEIKKRNLDALYANAIQSPSLDQSIFDRLNRAQEEITREESEIEQQQFDLADIIFNQPEHQTITGVPGYLSLLAKEAKRVVDGEKVDKKRVVRQLVKLLYTNDYVVDLIDEIVVTWKRSGDRCVPASYRAKLKLLPGCSIGVDPSKPNLQGSFFHSFLTSFFGPKGKKQSKEEEMGATLAAGYSDSLTQSIRNKVPRYNPVPNGANRGTYDSMSNREYTLDKGSSCTEKRCRANCSPK